MFSKKYSYLSTIILSTILIIVVIYYKYNGITNNINEMWPPLSTFDQQNISAKNAYLHLSQSKNLNAVLRIKSKDFYLLADEALKKQEKFITNIKTDEIENISITKTKFSLINQAIKVMSDFSFYIKEFNTTIKGKISGAAGLNCDTQNIVIQPTFSHVNINKIDRNNRNQIIAEIGEKAAIEFINKCIKKFINNINGILVRNPFLVPVDTAFSKSLTPRDLLKDKIESNISGDNIVFETFPARYIIYINKNAITIMIVDLNDNNDKIIHNESYQSFESLNSLLNQRLAENGFQFKKNNITAFYAKSEYVARILNNGFEHININIKKNNFVSIPEKDQFFSEEVRFHDRQRLPSCSGLRRQFENYSCDKNCKQDKCSGPCRKENCPSCKPLKLWKSDCGDRIACEARNAARKAGCVACKTAKAAEKAACDAREVACKTRREAQRATLKAENELRVSRCEANKLILKFVDGFTKVGEIKGQFKIIDSDLNLNINKLHISNDLKKLSLEANLFANAKTWLRVYVNPEAMGHIACLWNFRKTLENTVSVSFQKRVFNAALTVHQNDNQGGIILTGKTEHEIIDADLKPIPYKQLVNDPGFVLNCSLMSLAMPLISGVQLLRGKDIPNSLKAIFGDYDIKIDSKSFNILLKPVKIGSNKGLNFVLNPIYKENYIGFVKKE